MKKHLTKTAAFNVLALILAVAGGFGFADFEAAPEVMPIALGVVALINVIAKVVVDNQRDE